VWKRYGDAVEGSRSVEMLYDGLCLCVEDIERNVTRKVAILT